MKKFKVRLPLDKKYNLDDAIYYYATNDTEKLAVELTRLQIDTNVFDSIIEHTLYSKTGSDNREKIIVRYLGYIPKSDDVKHGYDGFDENNQAIEAKSKHEKRNITGNLIFHYNINDYTILRLEKDISNNPLYALGGFIDGQLIYVISFYFNGDSIFPEDLRRQITGTLDKIQETNTNRRTIGRITLNNIPKDKLKVYLVIPLEDLVSLRDSIDKNLFNLLVSSQVNGKPSEIDVKVSDDIEDLFG